MSDWEFCVDLETLGRHAGCAIVSVGLVAFKREWASLSVEQMLEEMSGHENYWVLDLYEQLRMGYKVEAATMCWWMQQEHREVFQEQRPISLSSFFQRLQLSVFALCPGGGRRLWSVGNDFDVAMLRWLFDGNQEVYPFSYDSARDVRTLCDVRGFDRRALVVPGLKEHNALDDAKLAVVTILKALGGG